LTGSSVFDAKHPFQRHRDQRGVGLANGGVLGLEGADLGSGTPSNGDVAMELSCYNVDGNHCQGAITWNGYRP